MANTMSILAKNAVSTTNKTGTAPPTVSTNTAYLVGNIQKWLSHLVRPVRFNEQVQKAKWLTNSSDVARSVYAQQPRVSLLNIVHVSKWLFITIFSMSVLHCVSYTKMVLCERLWSCANRFNWLGLTNNALWESTLVQFVLKRFLNVFHMLGSLNVANTIDLKH